MTIAANKQTRISHAAELLTNGESAEQVAAELVSTFGISARTAERDVAAASTGGNTDDAKRWAYNAVRDGDLTPDEMAAVMAKNYGIPESSAPAIIAEVEVLIAADQDDQNTPPAEVDEAPPAEVATEAEPEVDPATLPARADLAAAIRNLERAENAVLFQATELPMGAPMKDPLYAVAAGLDVQIEALTAMLEKLPTTGKVRRAKAGDPNKVYTVAPEFLAAFKALGEGWSGTTDETVAATGLPLGTVRTQLGRGRLTNPPTFEKVARKGELPIWKLA